ncbi:hypothetical protein LCGC14_2719670, partial [marine sediment metagenome]
KTIIYSGVVEIQKQGPLSYWIKKRIQVSLENEMRLRGICIFFIQVALIIPDVNS